MDELISCGLDLSGPYASFALQKGDKLICYDSFILENRNNSKFFSIFEGALSASGINITQIERWITGTGPGSFTGLRIASSYIMGLTRFSGKEAVGISSAFPIAVEFCRKGGDSVAVVFPSSKETVYLCSVELKSSGELSMISEPEYISKEKLCDVKLNMFAVLTRPDDRENWGRYLKKEAELVLLNKFPVENIFYNFGQENYTKIEELLYMRPPSVIFKV